MLSALSNLW